jgi:hypothetical protein
VRLGPLKLRANFTIAQKNVTAMQKIFILLGLLLATGGCQGRYHRLGMMEKKEEAS